MTEQARSEPYIDRFTNRPPTPAQAQALDAITGAMLDLDGVLHELLPPSRERSLALTKLEECSMWAKKATVFTDADTLQTKQAPAAS